MTTIVIFDGDCGLCNGFVAWLVRRDRKRRFVIAGSAGEVGEHALAAMGLDESIAASTLVLATADGPRVRSDAVIEILTGVGGVFRIAAVGRVVPRRVRDAIYGAIAARRPRRPAEDPACGTPPPDLVREWRTRLATREDVAALEAA